MSYPRLTRDRIDEIEERVAENAATIEERLEKIRDARKIPELDDLKYHEAKRFDLGIVFIDINDFKQYLDENDRRDVLFMLNLFITQTMELVKDFDGHFEKNTGDGALVYFGEESDPEKVVSNILKFLATLKLMLANFINPTLENKNIEPISISVGATYSRNVHITKIGIWNNSRRTLVSNSANGAFILEQEAGINEFYVNEGIKKHSDPAGFGAALKHVGFFDKYKWKSKDGKKENEKIYKFVGKWPNTQEENLYG